MERMAQEGNIEMSQAFYMEVWNGYERSKQLEEENRKLKSDLSECECSIHFESDKVGYRKRECKKLNEKVRFLEECLDRKEKLNEKYRKELEELKSTYVYDAKQVRDIC